MDYGQLSGSRWVRVYVLDVVDRFLIGALRAGGGIAYHWGAVHSGELV
jgi:hypothetical protein